MNLKIILILAMKIQKRILRILKRKWIIKTNWKSIKADKKSS